MAMRTPWGRADHQIKHRCGVTWVSTASHGGFMIAKGLAKTYLTEAAQKRGMSYGEYLAYEEDCDFAMVGYEHPELLPDLKPEDIFHSLSTWNAEYLLERGITPEPEGYAYFLARKKERQLRAEKSPDLIVSAIGSGVSWAPWVPEGKVGVWTADGKQYVADADTYGKRGVAPLLSEQTNVIEVACT